METEPGQDFTGLIEDLEKNAPNYNVFQAILIAEKISKKFHPERQDEIFDQKGLKFRPYEMYVFPPTDIRQFILENNIIQIVLNFMGLYGTNSPLPRCYHEQVAIQQAIHGPGKVPLQNFLDIFNNRFYWLYYQAWKKFRLFLQLGDNIQDKFTQRVFSFIGLGPHLNRIQTDISPFKLLQLSGILSLRIRNKMGLCILLKEFFNGCEIKVREFIPNQIKLSNLLPLGNARIKLGQNSILGRSMTDYSSKICIQIGPVDFKEYLQFLPDGRNMSLLKKLVELYLNDIIEYDVEILVKPEKIKLNPFRDKRLRLGQSLWLGKPAAKVISIYFAFEKLQKVA